MDGASTYNQESHGNCKSFPQKPANQENSSKEGKEIRRINSDKFEFVKVVQKTKGQERRKTL